MTFASVLALVVAAVAKPRVKPDPVAARLMARIEELESEVARLRRDLAAAQMLLAEAQRLAAVGQVNLANWQGHQTLALDAEFWRNCCPSRTDILTGR